MCLGIAARDCFQDEFSWNRRERQVVSLVHRPAEDREVSRIGSKRKVCIIYLA